MAKNRRRCYLDIGIDGSEEGRIVFELFDDLAPRTTENFIRLCTGDAGTGKRGVPLNYKGSCFHRIIKDFMCQGGDFTDGNGTGGESIYGGMFEDEPFIAKHDQPFLLSMANKGPNTNGSQFFITTRPTPHLNGKHVVFGRVVSGTEVVQKMELLKVDGKSKPIADVEILRCGELVRKRQTERREDDSDNEKSSKKKRRHSSSSEEEKENGKADIQISTVKAEDLPPEPANQHSYLMRRSRTPEDRKKKNDDRRRRSRSRDRHDRRGSDRRRDRSRSRDRHRRDDRRDSGRRDRNERIERSTGIKTKGRGVMRFQRDRSTTPPHWSRETKRLKTLDDLHSERERLGGGETVVRRMRGTHADANEDAVPAEKETEIKTETAIEASPRSVHSDAEGVDLSHSEDESDNEGDEAREQARALEALKEREREEKEQQQAKEEAELKSKKEKDEKEEKEKAAANKERSHSRSKTPERRRSRSRSHSRGRRSRSRSRDRRRSRSHERKRSPERRRAGRDRSSSRDHKRSRSRDRRRRDRSSSRDQRRRRSRSRDTRRRRSRSSS